MSAGIGPAAFRGLRRTTQSSMPAPTDSNLYRRGAATLIASWEEYARGAAAAAVQRLPAVAIAVFPNEPERGVYNNALLERDLAAAERENALDAMEAAYASAGVERFAVWAHETDLALRTDLERRGYTLDTATRAMGLSLDGMRVPRPALDLAPPDWFEYLRIVGVAPAPSASTRQSGSAIWAGSSSTCRRVSGTARARCPRPSRRRPCGSRGNRRSRRPTASRRSWHRESDEERDSGEHAPQCQDPSIRCTRNAGASSRT
jgi:hypothetical protein